MCAALIGGMDRLKQNYITSAKQKGFKLKVFTGKENKVSAMLGKADHVIIFTNQISHAAKIDIVKYTKAKNIPLHMYHSCGVSTLKNCLEKL
ncbi:DUF2325 domain-containing protein [Maridesulfovibrio ferrireducens]|uniref:DUF2325 domain-containing protein n=1 Tax=Maridesulfovibrio ferrireducens TaxID=246191 RepID=A0A1G9J250_9BACT|nr:DUF2325 domain-containing protein [Maridesulfovibrio ferrireducens]MBI9112561.1 DUF2325 domain-containing protein [Maridesulfovibrio ferrireducens]SDL31560.1 hypothetical protein SAMN05660337_2613 [Maridesulfovibrio ferrireducens]